MSKIEELIQQYCPDGVEYVKLGEIAEVGTGNSNGNEAQEDGKYPFFVRSQTIKRKNDYEYDEEAILIPGEGGIGDIFHYYKGKYALHQRVYRIHFTNSDINVKFAYYCMSNGFKPFILKKAVNATVTSIRKPMIESFEIPIPPLEVQEEIVRILDKFSLLTAELEAELELRRKQYDFYRNQLLSFDSDYDTVQWKKLGEVCEISIGEFVHKNLQKEEGIFPVYNGGQSYTGFYDKCNQKGNQIIMSARGANAGFVNRIFVDYWAGNSCYSIKACNLVNWNFLYYYLKKEEKTFIDSQQRGSIPAVSKTQLQNFSIPIPPLSEQQRIVDILDRFDALVNDLSAGLPAEIEARRKQYEYYRDTLLTFKRKAE